MFLKLLFSAALFCVLSNADPTVQLGRTTIIGSNIQPLGQEFFGGIPFAETPVGKLRFTPPVLKTTLGTSSFNATSFGASCLQLPTLVPLPGSISEDCLTINIFRPDGTSPSSKLPVMAWIYGGGFTSGGGSQYNGSQFVAASVKRGTPVIYANFNYRLGPLGFPQGDEATLRGALNLGHKDQLTALQWIQENIEAFGGDKTKVTVFGESAGAVSLGVLFLNSGLEHLARAAIFESGSANAPFLFNASHRQIDWSNFVSAVPDCQALASTSNTFDCLRNASSDELLQAFGVSLSLANEEFPWGPTIDGEGGVIPDLPSQLWEQGRFAKIPFMSGTNLDEGTLFTPLTITSEDTIRVWLITNHTVSPADVHELNETATKMLELYPDDPSLGSPFNTGNQTFGLSPEFKRLAAMYGDLSFQATRRLWMSQAVSQNVKTFGYLFTDTPPSTFVLPLFGVVHATDILYFYPNAFPTVQLSPLAQTLSSKMLDYWISFATSLDPNDGMGNPRPHWPQYTSNSRQLLQLNSTNTTAIADDYRAEQIGFINSRPVLFRH